MSHYHVCFLGLSWYPVMSWAQSRIWLLNCLCNYDCLVKAKRSNALSMSQIWEMPLKHCIKLANERQPVERNT